MNFANTECDRWLQIFRFGGKGGTKENENLTITTQEATTGRDADSTTICDQGCPSKARAWRMSEREQAPFATAIIEGSDRVVHLKFENCTFHF